MRRQAVVIVVGQDLLLCVIGTSPVPDGVSEYDYVGVIKGEPVKVIKGPFTGFPIPQALLGSLDMFAPEVN